MRSPVQVLGFWLGGAVHDPAEAKARKEFWYGVCNRRDEAIRRQFGAVLQRAARGELDGWAETPTGRLALVILLDQFSRNINRGTAAAFDHDARALGQARAAVEGGEDRELSEVERSFLYLPFQHAEDRDTQRTSVRLYQRLRDEAQPEFRDYADDCLGYAREHQAVIDRFGRFPHRNVILGRVSTKAEQAYLGSGARSYGQVAVR